MPNSASTLQIDLTGAGKKFFRNWIFRKLDLSIAPGEKIALLGSNGSGKSTLLQILAGYESLSEGTLRYARSGKVVERDAVFRDISLAAPYLELIEEFTLWEIIHFHFRMKKPWNDFSSRQILELTGLEASKDKVFKYFSSGMKQRAKLALAILSDTDVVLLDEPLSNLDKNGEDWYRNLAVEYLKDRTVIVCSNRHESEYFFCEKQLDLSVLPITG